MATDETPPGTAWRPLGEREAGATGPRPLRTGVPSYLELPLREWVSRVTKHQGPRINERVPLRLGLVVGSYGLQGMPIPQLLDVVDAALHYLWDWAEAEEMVDALGGPASEILRLGEILLDAGSAYELDIGGRCLRRRVGPTIALAAEHAIKQAPDPGRHLDAAWRAAYGIHPDPGKAYDEAIRAVEAAAIPVTLPNGIKETLGKVISHLNQAAAKWELAIEGTNAGDVTILVGMLQMLWQGHIGRHAGGPTSRPQHQDEAEMAVHLAATLVHWFTTGAIRRR
jgi:hypothetical protein